MELKRLKIRQIILQHTKNSDLNELNRNYDINYKNQAELSNVSRIVTWRVSYLSTCMKLNWSLNVAKFMLMMKGWYITLVLLLWLTACWNGAIHEEVDLIRCATESSTEVYKIMKVDIIRIYDMNNYIITNMENCYMQECLKVNAYKDIWAFYDDVVMIILMKACIIAYEQRKYMYIMSLHLEAVIWVPPCEGN